MTNAEKKGLVEKYVSAYNNFDIEAMLETLHDDIIFKNISGGKITLELRGLDAFEKQARQAAEMFSEREQKIENITFKDEICEVEIDYQGKIAADLPNNLKAGDKIELKGKSVFNFFEDGISEIADIS